MNSALAFAYTHAWEGFMHFGALGWSKKQLKWQKSKHSTQVLLYRYLCARTWCTETKSSVMHSLNSTYKTHNYKYTQHTRSLDAYTQGTVSSPAVERLPKEWGNHRRVDYDAPSSEWSVLGLPVHTWWLRCHYTEHMQGGECPCFLPPTTNLLMLIRKVSASILKQTYTWSANWSCARYTAR